MDEALLRGTTIIRAFYAHLALPDIGGFRRTCFVRALREREHPQTVCLPFTTTAALLKTAGGAFPITAPHHMNQLYHTARVWQVNSWGMKAGLTYMEIMDIVSITDDTEGEQIDGKLLLYRRGDGGGAAG